MVLYHLMTLAVRDGHEQNTVHVEQNAIADCARRGILTNGATAYITHYLVLIV